MTTRKVLFVTYGGGHVKMVLPVLRALRKKDPSLHIDVLGLTTAGAVLRSNGIASLGFADFVEPGDARALAWGLELTSSQASALVGAEESVAYLGLSFAELVAQFGERDARRRLARLGRMAFLPLATLDRVLRRLKPDVVVTTNSPRAERAAVLAARRLGIPALCMVDLFAIEEIAYMGELGYGDCICVLNEHVRRRFLSAGRHPEQVLVTGNPAFDMLADPALAVQGARLRAEWGGSGHILWASQLEPATHRMTGAVGDPGLPARIREALIDAVGRYPDWRLVMRPHPNEDPASFQAGGNALVSLQTQPLGPVLHAVDAVACLTSTVGYEAALLGKPLLHFPLSIYRGEADYTAMGLGLCIDRLDGVEKALHLVLSGRWRPPVQVKQAGSAAQAVTTALLGLLD